MSVRDGVAAAELQVAPSPEIEALSHLVRRGYLEHVGYSFGLLALLGALLSYSVARPLTRLAGYLREIYSGGVNLIPQDFHGAVNIMELENVRQALNDYKDRFIAAAATLEEKNKELLHLTFHDPLTGRYNRRAFEARLAHASETAVIEHQRHALCYVDLDQFKLVNDTCGHVAGDELLKQIAALLQGEIRGSDMLARLGGDEFGILFESCELDKATRIAEAIRLKVKKHRFVWQNTPFDISISIGLAAITADNPDVADALKNADAACYVAKESGRNRLQIYEQHDKELAQRHGEMQWVSRLQQALEENRFELYGQRIRPTLPDKNDCHYEVLLRLRNPDGQMVPPMAFIPAAERYNLMSSIDLWVVEHALDILVNHKRGPSGQPIMLAINLSGQSLGNKEILNRVQQWIETSGVGAERLCFEITETAAITNLTAAVDFIRSLRRLGCKFSLDDFGSGLSSFGYLSNLEIDFLKIDGHFITNILTDPVNRSIVGAINEIGHVMGIHTIAEFVENEAVVLELARIGVDYLQGYGIHKPEPLIELLDRLSTLPAADAPQRARN
jgi:diguanylate cyclase (GGDEF)-like protein